MADAINLLESVRQDGDCFELYVRLYVQIHGGTLKSASISGGLGLAGEVGLWAPNDRWIYIREDVFSTPELFKLVLYHEVAHDAGYGITKQGVADQYGWNVQPHSYAQQQAETCLN